MELDEKITFNGHIYSGRTIDVVHSDDGAKFLKEHPELDRFD